MKKIFQYTKFAVWGVLMVAVAACTEKEYAYDTPEALKGAQVYFSNVLKSQIEVDKAAGQFDITINRQNSAGSVTVPLTFTPDEGNIYVVPSQVTFADGESTAAIKVTFDPNEVEDGTYVGGTISFAGEDYETPFGAKSYTFKAGASSWVDMLDDNGKPVTVTYRDNLIAGLYSSLTTYTYSNIALQYNPKEPGMYRLVNPYAGTWPYANYNALADDGNEYYLTINAKDPDWVYIEESNVGCDLGEGPISVMSMVSYYLSKGKTLDQVKAAYPELFGKIENNVLTISTPQSCLAELDGALYYANTNGLFAVAFPGGTIADYSLTATYMGRFTDSNDNDFMDATITLGADVTTAKYLLVPIDEYDDALVSGIIDGTVAAEEIAESGAVRIPYTDSGKYVLILVGFQNGEYVSADAISLYLKSSHDTAETWTAAFEGTYKYTVKDYTDEGEGGKGGWEDAGTKIDAVLYQSNSNPNRYKIAPWANNEGEDGLIFTMDDETGVITVDAVYTGYTDDTYGDLFATDFLTYFGAESGAPESYYSQGVFYFNIAYHDATDWWFEVQDTFTITGTAGEGDASRLASKANRSWKAKHVKPVMNSGKAFKKSVLAKKFKMDRF